MRKFEYILVLAGNYQEYCTFLKYFAPGLNPKEPSNIIYVSSYERGVGFSDPLLLKIGSYRHREWARKLIEYYESRNIQKA
jgi:hypothetical protein